MDSEKLPSLAISYRRIAAENPEFPAIIREHGVITHGDLWQVVRSFAFRLRSEGVTAGSLIALNSADMLVALATLFASSLLGSRFVVAGKLLAKCQGTAAYAFLSVTGSHREASGSNSDLSTTAGCRRRIPARCRMTSSDCLIPDADWLYLHTSGTTGRAKYIALSERIVKDRTAAVAADFPFQQTTLATTFSVTSRPFFARAIATLMNAGAIVDSRRFEFLDKGGSQPGLRIPFASRQIYGWRQLQSARLPGLK